MIVSGEQISALSAARRIAATGQVTLWDLPAIELSEEQVLTHRNVAVGTAAYRDTSWQCGQGAIGCHGRCSQFHGKLAALTRYALIISAIFLVGAAAPMTIGGARSKVAEAQELSSRGSHHAEPSQGPSLAARPRDSD